MSAREEQHSRGVFGEGLGGTNIQGIEDSKAQGQLPPAGQGRPSDPDWVERKDPESIPQYMPGTGKGVAFDPGTMNLASLDAAPDAGGQPAGGTTVAGNEQYAVAWVPVE